MKLTIKFSGERYDPGDEYEERCEVEINGHIVASGNNFSECPEDANLGRDLSFVYNLPEVFQRVYDAGVDGEGFAIVEVSNLGL